jgi:hypothetical protein
VCSRASRGRRQNLIASAGAWSEIGPRGGFSSAPPAGGRSITRICAGRRGESGRAAMTVVLLNSSGRSKPAATASRTRL